MSGPETPEPAAPEASRPGPSSLESAAALESLQQTLRQAGADGMAYVQARWRLLQLELYEARAELVRLAVFASTALVLAVAGIVVLAVVLADLLAERTGMDRELLLAIEGGLLLAAGACAGWLGWRRCRREFRPLEQSLEELEEDLHWLRQHLGTDRR